MSGVKQDAVAVLREVLGKLVNEASGFLSMAEPSVHGYTNIAILRDRIKLAHKALQATATAPDEAQPEGGWKALALNQVTELKAKDDFIAHLQEKLNAPDEVQRLRSVLSQIQQHLKDSRWAADCDHKRQSCEDIGCNGRYFRAIEALLNAALTTTPQPARISAEAMLTEARGWVHQQKAVMFHMPTAAELIEHLQHPEQWAQQPEEARNV